MSEINAYVWDRHIYNHKHYSINQHTIITKIITFTGKKIEARKRRAHSRCADSARHSQTPTAVLHRVTSGTTSPPCWCTLGRARTAAITWRRSATPPPTPGTGSTTRRSSASAPAAERSRSERTTPTTVGGATGRGRGAPPAADGGRRRSRPINMLLVFSGCRSKFEFGYWQLLRPRGGQWNLVSDVRIGIGSELRLRSGLELRSGLRLWYV